MKPTCRYLCLICAFFTLSCLFCGCTDGGKLNPDDTPTPTDVVPSATETPLPTLSDQPTATPSAEPIPTEIARKNDMILPKSTEYSKDLALQLLTLCTGHSAEGERSVLTLAGFTVVKQAHYDKADSDRSHTSAYTLAKQVCTVNGAQRTVFLLAVRGTNAGEWYSNVDFSQSRNDADTIFADNFYAAALDIEQGVASILSASENPILLVCGHSRGAACANLLGYLLNQKYPIENTYVYTFATPTTYRASSVDTDCSNIFNFINPCDVVPLVPMESLGYRRLGTDIVLSGDTETVAALRAQADNVFSVAPSINAYYATRYSLTGAGESPDGMTAFEAVQYLADALVDMTSAAPALMALAAISPDSTLAPIAQMVISLQVDSDGGLLGNIATQHMPTTYAALIERLE